MVITADSLSESRKETLKPVISIDNLQVKFKTEGETVIAVNRVSFSVCSGETVCLVGESGSGKSVTSLSLMRLVEFGGGKITNGRMILERGEEKEKNLAEADAATMRSIRGNEIGMIFQEPMTSLNPVFTIERQ